MNDRWKRRSKETGKPEEAEREIEREGGSERGRARRGGTLVRWPPRNVRAATLRLVDEVPRENSGVRGASVVATVVGDVREVVVVWW